MDKPPHRPTFPKTNNNHVNFNKEESQDEEYEQDDYELGDSIEEEIYNEERLPTPIVSSLRTNKVENPIINLGRTKKASNNGEYEQP